MKKIFFGGLTVLFFSCCFVLADCQNTYAVPADIIFVFDESVSMGDEKAGVINNLNIFTQALVDAGIDAQYGLVGFGYSGIAAPHIRLVRDLTDASNFSSGLSELHTLGSNERGFEATKFALENITWRSDDVTKVIVMVTDEDSDGAESGADAALSAYHALWNGIVNFDDLVGPAGNYQTLAANHGGQIFDIHAIDDDPTEFFRFFAEHKVQEILRETGGGSVTPELNTLILLGVGLLGFVGLPKTRLF